MRWVLVPFWAKDIKVGFANIDAKAEGIESKPAFREAFRAHQRASRRSLPLSGRRHGRRRPDRARPDDR
jgi:putative SOS response-associated peptidase YedK